MRCARCKGFTLAELLVVVAVLATVGAVVVPSLASDDGRMLGVAASEAGNVLRLARAEAVRSGRAVLVDAGSSTGRIRLLYADCSAGAVAAVTDPGTRRAVDVAVSDGPFTRGVVLTPGFKANGSAYSGLVFDASGAAAQVCDVAAMSRKGQPQAGSGLTLAGARSSVLVTVDPPTGRISWP